MGGHLYRDAHVGMRARIAELEVRIRSREALLTKAFWSHLEPYVRERLAELRAGFALTRAESLQELARAEALLSAYEGELESWIARAPALEEAWAEVPADVEDPPLAASAGPRPARAFGLEFLRVFEGAVRDAAGEVQLVAEGWWSCLARFRRRNAPFALRASAIGENNGRVGGVSMELVTSVARAAPHLLVKHESPLSAIAKVMGLRREVEVGDASFDGLFLIQGAQEDALRLLVPKVRGFLLALARFDVPTLEIRPATRTASLSWCFEPAGAAIDAAVRTLASIRDVPREIAFRR